VKPYLGVYPAVIPFDRNYFDCQDFAASVPELTGRRGVRANAECIAMSHSHFWKVCRGEHGLSLERYLEVLALLQQPLGTWLRDIHDEPR